MYRMSAEVQRAYYCVPRKEQRSLLAKGKELYLSFQSKTSLDIFITLNSLERLIGMWQEEKQSELADQFSYGKGLLGLNFRSLQW